MIWFQPIYCCLVHDRFIFFVACFLSILGRSNLLGKHGSTSTTSQPYSMLIRCLRLPKKTGWFLSFRLGFPSVWLMLILYVWKGLQKTQPVVSLSVVSCRLRPDARLQRTVGPSGYRHGRCHRSCLSLFNWLQNCGSYDLNVPRQAWP